jgi:hypothetical protein
MPVAAGDEYKTPDPWYTGIRCNWREKKLSERNMNEGVAARMYELSGSVINLDCVGSVSRGSSGISLAIAMLTSGPVKTNASFGKAAWGRIGGVGSQPSPGMMEPRKCNG